MKNFARVRSAVVGAVLLGLSAVANAIPTLQLGIGGGTYDSLTQTVIASSNSFSLYAYLIPDTTNPYTDIYTISMAVSDQVSVETDLGSFKVDGNVINVTSGMNYGIPPVDNMVDDLQKHSVFPTYFVEKTFSFDSSNQSGIFNAEDHPSFDPQSGTGMYYKEFKIDVTNFDEKYAIHFDLYKVSPVTEEHCTGHGKKKICTTVPTGELEISQFAPFSHDAQSGPGGDGGGPPNETPEPAPMFLLGLGLLGMAWMRRKT